VPWLPYRPQTQPTSYYYKWAESSERTQLNFTQNHCWYTHCMQLTILSRIRNFVCQIWPLNPLTACLPYYEDTGNTLPFSGTHGRLQLCPKLVANTGCLLCINLPLPCPPQFILRCPTMRGNRARIADAWAPCRSEFSTLCWWN
jgi:hypothetical protein